MFSTEQLNHKLSHSEDQGRDFDFEAPVLIPCSAGPGSFRQIDIIVNR